MAVSVLNANKTNRSTRLRKVGEVINGLSHTDIILKILADGQPHFTREFIDAGLLEYRRRVSDLREEGKIIHSVKIGKRPGYQLIFKEDLFAA